MKRVGFIVNPVAGLGGSVALKGSDTPDIQRLARARGAVPRAPERAEVALATLRPALQAGVELLVAPGLMGESEAKATAVTARVVATAPPLVAAPADAESPAATPAGERSGAAGTTAADTRAAVQAMVSAGVDLIVFAGGDGTARDVYDALVEADVVRPGQAAALAQSQHPRSERASVPVVGIPAGCKIHSAVYAATPAAAGELARRYLDGTVTALADLEVMDIDEEAFRGGEVRARLHGFLRVPDDRRLTQGSKIGGRSLSDAAAARSIAERVVEAMEPGRLYLVGPGTTTRAIMERLGLEGTLLGVDVVRDGRLIARDATEGELLELLPAGAVASVIVTVIGGQGYILGRGNQQLSPAVLRRVGIDNLIIVATQSKLAALPLSRLLVDTGDAALDAALTGYRRVITGYREEAVLRVE